MKKFKVMAALVGAALLLSGCGSDSETAAEIVSESLVQNTVVVEKQSEIQSETHVEAETESETENETEEEKQSESEAAVEVEIEIETEKETEIQTQPKAEQTEPAPETVEAVPVTEGAVTAGDYAVSIGGLMIALGGDMRDYVGLLKEPDAYGSARSCTEAGEDKVYTYGGTVIYTYITNGADIISLIEITGGDYLPSGIHIGSMKEEVIAAYGSSYTEEGEELLYELGNKTIGLQMVNDKVSFIELFGQ